VGLASKREKIGLPTFNCGLYLSQLLADKPLISDDNQFICQTSDYVECILGMWFYK
jgi:hypothetical protein